MESSDKFTEVVKSGYGAVHLSDIGDVEFLVDMRSDTVTKPTKEMREAIACAQVGDDVMGEDPTVAELELRAAAILGKEASLFVPSGTMGNLIALLTHCRERGSEVLVGDGAHIFKYEQGGMAQFGGIQANKLPNLPDGTFSIELAKKCIRDHSDDHFPKTALICIENTHNLCGGRVLPLKWIDEVTSLGKNANIPVHMDGARLFNASVASKVPAQRLVRDVSSVNICLSKSLGAPCGSLLAGDKNFIRRARRLRKALGGGMRQVGLMAAAGLIALENISNLERDHLNARTIAKGINSLKNPYFSVDLDQVETNMIVLNVLKGAAERVCKRLSETPEDEVKDIGNSVAIFSGPKSESQIRLVLHSDITESMVGPALKKLLYVSKELFGSEK